MKKIAIKTFALLTVFVVIAVAGRAQANSTDKTDKIIFLNGIVREGKVIAFADDKIRFVHQGETLNYDFNRKEIEKIQYASGRSEMITARIAAEPTPVVIVSKNKVAVIPMQYAGYGNGDRKEDMSFYLQEIAISFLSKSAVELKFIDATVVNATLLNRGISDSNIRKYTAKDLAALLHVEYVIMGSVMQDNGTIISNAIINKTRKQDTWHDGDYRRRENSQQMTTTNQMVETRVTLSIYNETGEKLYTKSRHSLLSERDAYKYTIHYLLKRTALYKR